MINILFKSVEVSKDKELGIVAYWRRLKRYDIKSKAGFCIGLWTRKKILVGKWGKFEKKFYRLMNGCSRQSTLTWDNFRKIWQEDIHKVLYSFVTFKSKVISKYKVKKCFFRRICALEVGKSGFEPWFYKDLLCDFKFPIYERKIIIVFILQC